MPYFVTKFHFLRNAANFIYDTIYIFTWFIKRSTGLQNGKGHVSATV